MARRRPADRVLTARARGGLGLDEQQRRLFAGLESIKLGHGGDVTLAAFLGLDPHTVARGRQQLLDQNVTLGLTRRSGGGRKPVGSLRYTPSRQLLILGDTGGSNGYRCRAWETEFQSQLADARGLTLTVAHYPTGASKWNLCE